ncbi:3'-phosphoadenosine 5'-phosphosulfate sulfotransferase [Vermiconidia calcicola]|uniref:3'-phosphoadenosine 5'-phosphosulfate sulfotransferase n=1 Tax=Vermiconidia calcicola TaxID=1690605 RepID=A0ACC3N0I6_9PEZI|nr:3'-phosphoadenosine 5'-phosphosulfate sulfotransferase [Vermiconidia calcicola]
MPEALAGEQSNDVNHAYDTGDIKTITQEPTPPMPELCARIHQRVEAFLHSEAKSDRVRAVQAQSRTSLLVIEEALERYSPDELSLSYNGGKDCLVLLILYLSALHTHYTGQSTPAANNDTNHTTTVSSLPQTLRSVYILSRHPFAAVDAFVNLSVRQYHLSLSRYALPMREAFASYLHDQPPVKAIFVGTRRTDPHGADLTHFDPTDRGWPAFMRIHPVIDWHYAEIWCFIRELGVEYCELYDLGYTSLGGTEDTHPNPALAVGDGKAKRGIPVEGEGRFRPAYELIEDGEERLGRDGRG